MITIVKNLIANCGDDVSTMEYGDKLHIIIEDSVELENNEAVETLIEWLGTHECDEMILQWATEDD